MIGYLVIGALIAVTQLWLSKVFKPQCAGVAEHILWQHFDWPNPDTYEVLRGTRTGQHPERPTIIHVLGIGLGLARWLPDLYQEVITGDMDMRSYLLGGHRCNSRDLRAQEWVLPLSS